MIHLDIPESDLILFEAYLLLMDYSDIPKYI